MVRKVAKRSGSLNLARRCVMQVDISPTLPRLHRPSAKSFAAHARHHFLPGLAAVPGTLGPDSAHARVPGTECHTRCARSASSLREVRLIVARANAGTMPGTVDRTCAAGRGPDAGSEESGQRVSSCLLLP